MSQGVSAARLVAKPLAANFYRVRDPRSKRWWTAHRKFNGDFVISNDNLTQIPENSQIGRAVANACITAQYKGKPDGRKAR